MSKIRDARINKGLTQQNITDILGIPKRTLENWEQGSRKPSEWLEKLVVDAINNLK